MLIPTHISSSYLFQVLVCEPHRLIREQVLSHIKARDKTLIFSRQADHSG